jgi:hypothetical protein
MSCLKSVHRIIKNTPISVNYQLILSEHFISKNVYQTYNFTTDELKHPLITTKRKVMKAKFSILALLFTFLSIIGFSQEKSKKQIKEEKKIEAMKQVEALINAKEFVFSAKTALPTGFRSVNLSSNTYDVRYNPELIKSELPFYGRAYSGVGFGNDTGMKFEGKPEEFAVTKGKKNYSVKAVVKGGNDRYTLSLSVGFEGDATLSITSNNRSSISYHGEISKLEE